MSKCFLLKFSTWGGGLATALGLILSEVGRNILDFCAPQYFGLPFRDDEKMLTRQQCHKEYPVSDGEAFWN